MTVQSELNEISPVMVEVKVEVPWEMVSKELNANFKVLARTAKVRGFRPGKVPAQVVRKLYGKQVEAEVTGTLIERGLMEAVDEHKIAIVAQPEVDQPIFTKGEGLKFTAKIEVQPKIEDVKLDTLTVNHIDEKVSDEDVDGALERVRVQNSDLREPEPMRGAQKTDVLTLDYAVRVEGELHPDLGSEGRDVDLGEEGLLDAFVEGLMGMKPGDKKGIEVTFPEDNPREELAGKPAVFEVEIKELKERLLPDLDDELAQDAGEFETLDELKADIRKQLSTDVDRRNESVLREKLIDALIALNDIPVPPSMLQQQRQQMLYELVQFAQMTGQQLDPAMMGDVDARAERRVRAGLVLGALARLQKIEVSEDEMNAKLAEIAENTGKHIAKVKVEHTGERRDQLENQLLEEKITAFLKSKAKIVEKADEPKTEAKADAGEKKADKKPKKKKKETAAEESE